MHPGDPFEAFAVRERPRIEAALDSLITKYGTGAVSGLGEAMRYSLLNPGKRIRPLLTLLACEACGGQSETALPAACAVEMVHVFSLIHDDLPAMDDDDLRRGKPTNHKVFGEAEAILAGDALLALAFEVLAGEIPTPSVAVDCVRVLSGASGTRGMTGGQWEDIRGEGEHVVVCRRKTAALIEAAAHIGALVAGASAEQVRALREFGWRVGLAFQFIDDVLDREGDTEALRSHARALTQEAMEQLSVFGERGETLRAFARKGLERTK